MYVTLKENVKTTLQKLVEASTLASYSNVPGDTPSTFPHVFFKPEGFDNEFHTGQENYITYRFLMIVMVTTEGTGGSSSKAFDEVLPATVDAIVDQFNEDWNQGAIDGHRVWCWIDSAAAWELSEEDNGLVAYAPLTLQFRLLVDV
ncbi:MAG: hypothetical protein Tp172MES00d2C118482111_5 [Prokaryotic dsDNA virus sp.]|nr:MAG: hypothetical protein Tp172MES00d2C118482111_5 [Prokaryotic dsDNA virus sp.]|tara:strand:- start:13927 stop:14364 length:438 start_codon:yes stop_codon:yes gene_type:complete